MTTFAIVVFSVGIGATVGMAALVVYAVVAS